MAEIPSPVEAIRNQFESMVGVMHEQMQQGKGLHKDILAGVDLKSFGQAVQFTGTEQVAARPVGDMSQSRETGIV
jgi:hypothetical protein